MPCETPPGISFWSGALVAIVAATIAHLFSLWRESTTRRHAEQTAKLRRKIEFVGLMGGIRAEAARIVGQAYVDIFPKRLFEISREAAKIAPDLDKAHQGRFADAISALGSLTDSQIEEINRQTGEYIGRARVASALDDIVAALLDDPN